LAHANPIHSEAGELVGAVNIIVDITERKSALLACQQAEAALRNSEERFREVMGTVEQVFWRARPDLSEILYVNPAYERIWGRSCESLYRSPLSWAQAIHPDDRKRVLQAALAQATMNSYQEEYRITRPDGTMRWIRDRGFPVHDENGNVVRLTGVAEDITERKRLEEQLRQAQKMEAIGQLAGGVAHDFNNLLTIITGFSEVILLQLAQDSPYRSSLLEVCKAGERAASLTRQLLAFSRKQIIAPEILNLNTLVGETEKMLHRLIGEDITLVSVMAPDLHAIKADPGQIEQILMNLAVNARDAMPRGGKLTTETANVILDESYSVIRSEVRPGPYVMLAVSDTGCGMDKDLQARIFEPFFTTKGPGQGTGLGLATVYGIVKQAGGYIYVYSEPDTGTTFKIYLPSMAEQADYISSGAASPQAMRGCETVLLVEDDDNVRAVARHVLEACGYVVLEADSGEDALKVLQEHVGPIHLVISDVVMPTMNGPALAEYVAKQWPHTKFLFVSGYTDDAVVRNGVLRADVNFLQKPFSPRNLARKVREILDAKPLENRN
ncbi:MAG: PAS domain S-box protein, partial [Planctomycetes bacterium]|nr:PAS domain S-box protein [Planctomycetota bacterium]